MIDSELQKIALLFQIGGELIKIEPHKSGHINRSYLSTWKAGSKVSNYLHQRINESVFRDVEMMMRNISVVTDHLVAAQKRLPELAKDVILKLIKTRSGELFARAADGSAWRTYEYIGSSYTLDVCPDARHAGEAAAILGRFQLALADLPCQKLGETIPGFFSSPGRFQELRQAIPNIAGQRSSAAKREVEFALQREEFASLIETARSAGRIPTRAVHGDMKLNNVLFGENGAHAVSIVDLDTCMPGYALYDFGDLARSSAVATAEDETDLEKISLNMEFFAALVRGYLTFARGFLQKFEIALLPLIPRLLALTLGVRFLSDYLNNDVYFRVADDQHNLRRARAQFQLVRVMEEKEQEMKNTVEALL